MAINERTVIGILGATGAVGREAMTILEERGFPKSRLRLFASGRSRGKLLPYGDGFLSVEEATRKTLSDCDADILLGMTGAQTARELADAVAASGAVWIDNSSAFRLHPEVPLVIPEVNGEDIAAHHGIVSNPNCSTILALTAIAPIAALSSVKSITASTYQAVSGAGARGLASLEEETDAVVNRREMPPCTCFPYPIAGNLIPQIGDIREGGYTDEEWKMQREGREILHLPELRVSCTCVRIPVRRCHGISLTVRTEDALSLREVEAALASGKGIRLCDTPMPLLAEGREEVLVGRVRRGNDEKELCLFCCGDQLRKGAAGNALQIADRL